MVSWQERMAGLMEFITLPMAIIFVGGFIVVVGGLMASVRQNQDQAKFANERAEFERDLRIKSDKIAELNETIAASVIGGDSFCYVSLISANQTGAYISVTHQGKYPLYDVSVRMVELDAFGVNSDESIKTLEDIQNRSINLDVGNMSPGFSQMTGKVTFSNPDKVKYNIFIVARNGSFTQNLRMHNVNGVWKSANRVMRDNFTSENPNAPPTILIEQIDPDFPKNKDGQPDWE
jgi:hypothetical protein